jgi:hypothetical protein
MLLPIGHSEAYTHNIGEYLSFEFNSSLRTPVAFEIGLLHFISGEEHAMGRRGQRSGTHLEPIAKRDFEGV